VKDARRDLCGGHPAMGVPTAIEGTVARLDFVVVQRSALRIRFGGRLGRSIHKISGSLRDGFGVGQVTHDTTTAPLPSNPRHQPVDKISDEIPIGEPNNLIFIDQTPRTPCFSRRVSKTFGCCRRMIRPIEEA
jgi:hypothetical protein